MMVVFSQKRPLLVGLVILISASILILVLILGGRIRPKPHPGQVNPSVDPNAKTRPINYQARVYQRKDSATQPVNRSLPPLHPPVQKVGENSYPGSSESK
jgi:hypothetical protein